jgi:hypothetical protein
MPPAAPSRHPWPPAATRGKRVTESPAGPLLRCKDSEVTPPAKLVSKQGANTRVARLLPHFTVLTDRAWPKGRAPLQHTKPLSCEGPIHQSFAAGP